MKKLIAFLMAVLLLVSFPQTAYAATVDSRVLTRSGFDRLASFITSNGSETSSNYYRYAADYSVDDLRFTLQMDYTAAKDNIFIHLIDENSTSGLRYRTELILLNSDIGKDALTVELFITNASGSGPYCCATVTPSTYTRTDSLQCTDYFNASDAALQAAMAKYASNAFPILLDLFNKAVSGADLSCRDLGFAKYLGEASTPEPDPDPDPDEMPFEDVNASAFYYEPVVWAVANGITNGVDATHFGPDASCTRGQVVTFLWRTKGSPDPATTGSPFFDVNGGYYYDAILWAVSHGITTGADPTHFKPDDPCTRGQVTTFLWRTAGSPAPSAAGCAFTDVQSSAFYYNAMLWAVEKGVTNGMSATSFAPGNTCTRGQIVTFLYRAQEQMTGSLGTVPVVDKRDLYNAISVAESKDQSKYTSDSWSVMASALLIARDIYAEKDATQSGVDDAASTLWSAINGLKEKTTQPVNTRTAVYQYLRSMAISRGSYNTSSGMYLYSLWVDDDHSMLYSLGYSAEDEMVGLSLLIATDSGTISIVLGLFPEMTSPYAGMVSFAGNEGIVFLYPETYTKTSYLSFYQYSGYTSLKSNMLELFQNGHNLILVVTSILLQGSYTLADMGYLVFESRGIQADSLAPCDGDVDTSQAIAAIERFLQR